MRGRGEGWGIVAWSSQDQAILQAMLASDIDECRSTGNLVFNYVSLRLADIAEKGERSSCASILAV